MKKDGKAVTKDEDVNKPGVVANTPDEWDDLNFTFSIGSNRRNVQLITGLVQPLDSRTRGTVNRADGYATIQVQVSAASSVLNARVRGFYQMITKSPGPISIKSIVFADNGQDGDTKADDGIYTAKIDIHEVDAETEFRVFVLADTTNGQAHYIPLDNPNRDDLVPDPVDLAALPVTNGPRTRRRRPERRSTSARSSPSGIPRSPKVPRSSSSERPRSTSASSREGPRAARAMSLTPADPSPPSCDGKEPGRTSPVADGREFGRALVRDVAGPPITRRRVIGRPIANGRARAGAPCSVLVGRGRSPPRTGAKRPGPKAEEHTAARVPGTARRDTCTGSGTCCRARSTSPRASRERIPPTGA